ncbi:hypothetical protein [Fulvimarina sp. MAC3]|uniref:hypothetical protein n=1 Tax=Fulvimarina sp. MAC3 TaxID=3148887 RepID=UPI0031FCF57E
MSFNNFIAAGSFVFSLATGSAALAQGDDYFERYSGDWEGGGRVQLEKLPKPVNVSCEAEGTAETETEFKLQGTCSAMLVLSNNIGAELVLDTKTGQYTGVYTGSESGPAKLAGTRNGDSLDLEVTWNKVIYNDDKAVMTITNDGDGSFVLKVTEEIDGKDVVVSDLSFTEKKAQ